MPNCGNNSSEKNWGSSTLGTTEHCFRPYYRLKIFSNLKSPVPLLNKINVVYKINCMDCNEFYIGRTKRNLHIRLKEHKARHYSVMFQ